MNQGRDRVVRRMETKNIEKNMQWLRFNTGPPDETTDFFEKMIEQRSEDKWIPIGDWYYYLNLHGTEIHLCRTRGKMGLPSITETMSPAHLAISDDDLECAVQYESCGTFQPGQYRISPLIERKLRILFE